MENIKKDKLTEAFKDNGALLGETVSTDQEPATNSSGSRGDRAARTENLPSESPDVASKFPRHTPQIDLEIAEQTLFAEMEHAARLYQSEEDFGRNAARHALQACVCFSLRRGLSGQALKALADLMGAFDKVDEGTLPELFDPKVKPGQLPDRKWSRSALAQEVKIHAAACMDALMKGGASKEEAAKRVARSARNWPRASAGIIKSSTVTNWRDELLQQTRDSRERIRFEKRSRAFRDASNAKAYLVEALRMGPPLTGAVRKRREKP